MSVYLDDELPKNDSPQEDDFFGSSGQKPKNELPYVPPDPYSPLPPARPSKKSGCFFLTPIGCVLGLCLSMVGCFCVLPIGLTAAGVGVAAIFFTNEVEKSGTDTLVLENPENTTLDLSGTGDSINLGDSANIVITGGPSDAMRVDYRVLAYGLRESDAQALLDNVTVSLVQQGNRVTISTDDNNTGGLAFYNVEFTLIVPYEMGEILINPSSELTIENVTARFEIDGGINNVNLTNVSGIFDVETDLGNINFSGDFASNSNNTFVTTLGDVNLVLQEPLSLTYTAQTSSGTLNCPDAGCRGSYGDRTSSLSVVTTSGDITIRTSR